MCRERDEGHSGMLRAYATIEAPERATGQLSYRLNHTITAKSLVRSAFASF